MSDKLTRLIFDNYNIRGVAVQIADDVNKLISEHNYPEPIAKLLLEAVAINAMLTTTLKFEGRISLQLQTPGSLSLLLVQTNHNLSYRGVARFEEDQLNDEISFADMVNNGQMVITIEPDKGQRYQGIVALEADSLAGCIENYFAQSEQLRTKLFMFTRSNAVFGLLLQALPDLSSETDFEHVETLANTLTEEEAFELDNQDILHRLFHEELVRSLSEEPIQFECQCSRDKMLSSLQLLQDDEITEILEADGHIEIQCEFCLNQYKFNELDIKSFLAVAGNETRH